MDANVGPESGTYFPIELCTHGKATARNCGGFTLVEMLATVCLVLAVFSLAAPAWNSLTGAQNATTAAYEIAEILQGARAYAMANNTHVFVGILEENEAQPVSDPAPRTGIGRVVMAAFASCDGTKGYDNHSAPQTSWINRYSSGANLRPIGKLLRIENLHLSGSLGPPPASGGMARPDVNYYYRLGHPSCTSVTPITWPIGRGLDIGYQYRFDKVIRFDPFGTARIQYKTNTDTIAHWMEIGLQQTHGNLWPGPPSSPNGGNQTAVVIDSITGAVRIYRPL